jgi:hypothetical protein
LIDEAIQAGSADPVFELTPGGPAERLTLLITSLVESRRLRPELHLLLDHMRASDSAAKKLKRQMQARKEAFLHALETLIREGQATGTIRSGDAGQLTVAIGAVLEGLTAIARHEPERFRRSCPDAEIILRMLIPARVETRSSKKNGKSRR